MSKRLQVVVDDHDLREIRRAAAQAGQTVSEWVRQATRAYARDTRPSGSTAKKLALLRAAMAHEFATADIDVMLTEIEAGYADPTDA